MGWEGSSRQGHSKQSRALTVFQAAGLCGRLGAESPGLHPLLCPWLAAGSRATPAPGCAPGRAAGTPLQMAVLEAWVEEEGGFPAVLEFCSFFIIKI